MRIKQVFHAYNPEKDSADTKRYRFCCACAAPLPETTPEKPHPSCPACGWILYRNPATGVVILITEGERVLLGRRGNEGSYAPGTWCLPGGFIEYDEDFLSAAIREVLEETGLEVEIVSLLSVMSNFLKPELHTLVVVLKARIIGGDFRPGDDLTELGWYPLGGPFPEMAFEADQSIIDYYHATALQGAPVDRKYTQTLTSHLETLIFSGSANSSVSSVLWRTLINDTQLHVDRSYIFPNVRKMPGK